MSGGFLNNMVRSMFDGYKEARETNVDKRFNDLNWSMDCWIGETSTPLADVSELNELVNLAENEDHYNAILDHMYRHDATRVAPYKKIEKKIINKMWEE
jgi:hypothetical protein